MILTGFCGAPSGISPGLIHAKLENVGYMFYFVDKDGNLCSVTSGEFDIPKGIIVAYNDGPMKHGSSTTGSINNIKSVTSG